MKIDVKYTQIQATKAVEDYLEKRIGSLERFLKSFEKNQEIIVFFEIARISKHHRQGDVYYAEATFKMLGKTIRAEHTGSDIYMAIDMVREKLQKEVRRYKDKLVEAKRRT